MFSILRNRQTVFQNLQACIWDLAIHVLRIPIPCVFAESQLIGQVTHRWWMCSKELQNLPIPAAALGTDSEIMSGSRVLDGDTEDAGLRSSLRNTSSCLTMNAQGRFTFDRSISMSGASILIMYHASLAFASLYFQWHATELLERVFFAAFSMRLALSLLCTIATIKTLNTANLFREVTPSMLQIRRILWLWGSGGICIGDRFFEDMFLWASIFKDQAEHITARRSRVPLFLVAELVMRPSAEGGQVWRSSSFLPALIIIYDNNTLPNGKILNERFRPF